MHVSIARALVTALALVLLAIVQVKGSETIMEGTDQIITVLTWTSEANWSNQVELMRALPARVSGIR
jgi:hypothetical protein